MKVTFSTFVSKRIEAQIFEISLTSDISSLIAKFKASMDESLVIYETLLAQKTSNTDLLRNVNIELNCQKKEHKSTLVAINIWTACELGDTDYIEFELIQKKSNQISRYC